MKKLVLLMGLAASMVLTACGGSEEKVISGEVNNVVTESAQAEEVQTESTQADVNGYVFVSEGVTIEVDGEAQAYVDGMSEPVSVYESPSCAFGDLDKIHTYSGFEMDTYSMEGVDYVSAIIFLDDSVSTVEGVAIGATVEDVKAAYGEPTTEESTIFTYEKDEMKLCFLIKDNSVVSVEYRTMILE